MAPHRWTDAAVVMVGDPDREFRATQATVRVCLRCYEVCMVYPALVGETPLSLVLNSGRKHPHNPGANCDDVHSDTKE